jgi:kynurenine 3-monooxygenase
MSTRGWKALDVVGRSVHEIAIPMDKRAIHLVDNLIFKITVKKGEYLFYF